MTAMLSENMIRGSKSLQSLQFQDFKKVINYSINFILNHENQMKLNEFIQIQQELGDELTSFCLSLISALVRYRSSAKEFENDINMLLIAKERKQYFIQKIRAQLYELRKIVYAKQLGDITNFKNLDWRFEIQMGSKASKNTFIPNVFMSLHTEDKGVAKRTAFNTNLANLKNLHQSLLQAMKLHNSNSFKLARNSSV